MTHDAPHRTHRSGWLRASLLGAMDGAVSISSLIVGVAAAETSKGSILIAGVAGLVAGAMSMAAGEYVSVQSQLDTERADLTLEQRALDENYDLEIEELAAIYRDRGLDQPLATEVARQLMAHNALEAHARDEIGITSELSARPLQASMASAATFAVSGALPLVGMIAVPISWILWAVPLLTVGILAALGAAAAKTGGASLARGALRVCVWGSAAMLFTAIIGHLFGIAI